MYAFPACTHTHIYIYLYIHIQICMQINYIHIYIYIYQFYYLKPFPTTTAPRPQLFHRLHRVRTRNRSAHPCPLCSGTAVVTFFRYVGPCLDLFRTWIHTMFGSWDGFGWGTNGHCQCLEVDREIQGFLPISNDGWLESILGMTWLKIFANCKVCT